MYIFTQEVLLISQLFGAFPFYYVHKKGKVFLRVSRKISIWGCALFIFQTIAVFSALYLDLRGFLAGTPIQMNSKTAIVAVIFDIGTLYILAISVIVFSITKSTELLEYHNTLQKFDSAFQYSNEKSRTLKVLIVVMYVVSVLGFTSFVFFISGDLKAYIPVTLSINATQAGLFINFTYVCQTISDRFNALNDKIRFEIVKKRWTSLVNENLDSCIPKIHYVRGSFGAGDLRVLADLYWLLCDAVRQANAFYCTQLLAAILSCLIHITITLYYFITHSSLILSSHRLPYLAMEGVWVITHASYLLLILSSSTSVTDAADSTALLVCKLINKDLDSDLKSQMQKFLLQLLHHNARFSAYGLFHIDSKILTSIAGSVSTYLVVLVQFQMQSQTPFEPLEPYPNLKNNCMM